MGKISDELNMARERAERLGLPYAGALTPREAFDLWHAPGAVLVDVRTQAELTWVGRIPRAVEIEYMHWPDMDLNPNFRVMLEKQVDKESLVMFICRSGQRSHQAALIALEAGFTNCYNVLEGFEGDKDANHQRGMIGGWRHAGLPWIS